MADKHRKEPKDDKPKHRGPFGTTRKTGQPPPKSGGKHSGKGKHRKDEGKGEK